MMKIFCAIIIWILISAFGFLSLPLLQQTGTNLAFVIVAVLSGPIAGIISTLADGTFINACPILFAGLIVCAACIVWYRKRSSFLSFLVALLSWTITGLLLSVGIYV